MAKPHTNCTINLKPGETGGKLEGLGSWSWIEVFIVTLPSSYSYLMEWIICWKRSFNILAFHIGVCTCDWGLGFHIFCAFVGLGSWVWKHGEIRVARFSSIVGSGSWVSK